MNKRKQIRVTPELGRPIRVDINGDNFLDILLARDISMGGIGLLVPHRFKDCSLHTDVEVIVSLPHPVNKSISFKARIEHISSMAFGISFAGLEPAKSRKVKQYIAYRLNKTSWIEQLRLKLDFI